MKRTAVFLVVLFVASLLAIQGTSAASPSILISEVAYDGIGTEADSEFVELYNPTSSAIDLTGWTINDNVGSFSLSGTIAAGSFFVIGDNQAGFEATYGVSADQYGSTLALSNTGDQVILKDASGTEIDFVAWEGYVAGWTLAANTGDSLHRTSLTDSDTQNDFVVEAVNPTSSNYLQGTSGTSILISEVAYDGIGTEADSEFVELYNPSGVAVDLTGWSISDNFATFTLSGSIPAGGFFVVADNQAGFEATYGVSANQYGSTLALSNSGDQVMLSDDSGTEVDFVAWEGYVAGWTISATTGNSLHRTSTIDTDTQDDFVSEAVNPTISNYLSTTPPEPDTTPPTVSITNPAAGATLGGTVTITTSSSDNVAVDYVEIFIDGSLVATASSYAWDTTTVTDGSHSISATAYDTSGNSNSDAISVTVDNANYVPPAIGHVKIMAYNVEASGANADWKQVIKEENADIVLLVETGDWDNTGDNSILQGFCDEFNAYFVNEDPYNCVQTMNVPFSTSGEAIMSRFPITYTNQIALVTLDDGSTHDPSHDFLHATIDIGDTPVNFIASHLKCCGGDITNYEKRIAQQEGIINYMDDLGNVPIVYAGDLNSFSPEDGTSNLGDLEYHPMSMLLQDTSFHDMSSKYSTVHTFDDPLTTLYPGQFYPTYGHQNSIYTSRIDFVTVNQYFSNTNYIDATVGDTATADTGSDHYSTDFTYDFGGSTGGDTTPPSQVTGLTATAMSSSQIDLAWAAATDDVGVDHYNIYRDGTFLTSVTTTSYSDTGLAALTTYSYTVSAVDAAGNEGLQSSSASTTTDASADTEVPSQVTGLSAIAGGTSQIDLTWNAATDNVGVDHYNILRDGVFLTSVTTTSYSDTGLTASTTYSYTVSAVDAAGNEGLQSSSASATTEALADTEAPSQVTGLSATAVGTSQIDLSWAAASDNVGVDHYNIYRDGVFLTSVTTTSYSDTGLTASTSYSYAVSAVDAAGNEGLQSSTASATTEAESTTTDMYVSSITVEKTNIHPKNGKFDVLVQVTILDANGNPVEGASVTIDFQVPRGDVIQYTAETDANGVASYVITPPGHSTSGTFTVTVVEVIATGFAYNPSLNVETTDSATLT